MKRTFVSIMAGVLALVMCVTPGNISKADSAEVKPYIAFGADLSSKQKNAVMEQLGVTSADLADYETIKVTNADEHKYLDSYLDSSVIGSRALSSVKIEEADSGSGVNVETHNISFCTKEMYTNALITAGISDADVTVAAPFKISGTAALVGAMKAYGTMTGEEVNSDSADAATNELVLTGELSNELGSEEAAKLVALLKDKVVSGDLTSADEITGAIEDAADEMNITLTDGQKTQLQSLMKKIGGLNLDSSTLKDQAKGVYDKLKDMGVDLSDADGIWDQICNFFSSLLDSIANFFKSLF